MKYTIGKHFEVAWSDSYDIVTLTWLLPSLDELQTAYEELYDQREYEEFLDDIVDGWKQKEFLQYFYDEETDMFFDEILDQEKRTGVIKDIKLIQEGKRNRLTCWWNPPDWFRSKAKSIDLLNAIVNESIQIAISDRL